MDRIPTLNTNNSYTNNNNNNNNRKNNLNSGRVYYNSNNRKSPKPVSNNVAFTNVVQFEVKEYDSLFNVDAYLNINNVGFKLSL